jgi:hypothetical protein
MYFNCTFTNFIVFLRIALKFNTGNAFPKIWPTFHHSFLPLILLKYEKLLIYHNPSIKVVMVITFDLSLKNTCKKIIKEKN